MRELSTYAAKRSAAGSTRQVGGLPVGVERAHLGAGEVQQRVHHAAQPLRGAHRRLQVVALG